MKKILLHKLALSVCIVIILFSLGGLVSAAPAAQAGGAPSVVSYQGHVQIGDSAFTGTGYFKFAIVNSSGSASYWSNDNTSSSGSEPTASVALTVNEGLFNVLLGDTTLAGMTQTLTEDVFSGTDRWLRIWFSSDGNTFQLLSPDQRIAAVPYALQAEIAADADTLDGADGSAYQLRISESCTVGSTIQAVNADGTIVCETHDTRPIFSRTTLDSDDDVGAFTSLTIGADGLPVISYYDNSKHNLKVVHCGNAACTEGNTLTTIDSTGNVGSNTSITIGADGLPVISYCDNTNYELKVAHCGNVACTEDNTTTTINSTGDVGAQTSIAIGTDGLPVISYYRLYNANLRVVHCGNATCTDGNTISTVDNGTIVGEYSAIAIGVDGLPVISYYAYHSTNLKVAHCEDIACTTSTLTIVDSNGDVGKYTDITIGVDGLPVISYYDETNTDLKVAHCEDALCTTSTITTLNATGNFGLYTSITIGADGLPVISFYESSGNLRVAHCGDATCTTSSIIIVDSTADVGTFSSIAIGMDGLPVISCYNDGSDDLKFIHCSNEFCVPYWRR